MRFPYQSDINAGLTPMQLAVAVYHARNKSKEELSKKHSGPHRYQPIGFWHPRKLEGVWYPVPLEVRPCCWDLQSPTAKYGWTLHRHCRTVRHVAMLCNVDDRHLYRELGIRKDQTRCHCGAFCPKSDYLCKRHREIQDSLNNYQRQLGADTFA